MAIKRLTQTEQGAWRGFLAAHARIWREMERRLAPTGLSLTDYDVLVALEEAGADGVRMSELAKRTTMSASGFTRLADRLERQGYIERRPCPTDGRGLLAVATPEGRRALNDARRTHLDDVRELFLAPLDEEDMRHLAAVWERMRAAGAQDGG